MRYKVEEQQDLTIPEDMFVRARLEEIKTRTINWNDKQTNEPREAELLQWWWEVQNGDYKGRRVKGECDSRLSSHPNNTFRQWAEALLQRELGVDMEIDTDDLLGLQADITVKHTPDRRDPNKKWEEVDVVVPISGIASSDDVPF